MRDKNFDKQIKNKFAYISKITYDYSEIIGDYNTTIVLTQERKSHILKRHPEMNNYMFKLIEYINSPDDILLDKKYDDTINIIKYIDKNSFVFITVKFAKASDFILTSIISARYQHNRKNKKR